MTRNTEKNRGTTRYCTALYCTVLYYRSTILSGTVLYCTILYFALDYSHNMNRNTPFEFK